MYISQTLYPFYKFSSPTDLIKRFKDAGFDAFDFSFCDLDLIKRDDYIDYMKNLREYAEKIGIVCNQAHAPFPTIIVGDEEYNQLARQYIIRSMESASILGAKIIVIHPANKYRYKENIELYNSLLPYAKKYNIKIGIENMWERPYPKAETVSPCACSLIDDFTKTLQGLDPNYFVACLDVGHAEMFKKGYAVELIYALAPRLEALHIHDNDLVHDKHWIPGQGYINFNDIAKALKEINYKGDITLEVMNDKDDDINNKLDIIASFSKKFRGLL